MDGTDYSRIDAAYLADKSNPRTMTGWYNRDFNYDGLINGSDYTLLDNAFNRQGVQLTATVASSIASASEGSAVPEPGSITALVVAGLGGLGRRPARRRR